jgi:hypothetical protein
MDKIVETAKEEKTLVVEPVPRRFLADRWKIMRGWWSVHVGVAGIVLMAAVPELSDQYFPNIAPALLHWFPNHGQQWVPIGGAVLAIIARIVSQAAVIARIKSFFRKKSNDTQ